MHRPPNDVDDRPKLPGGAVGIVLGIWVAVFLILAVIVVPVAFSACGIAL